MPGGSLPRAESELLILRVAHNTGCDYEWHHHERLGAQAGLSPEEIARVRSGPDASGLVDAPARRMLRAADELHADRDLTDALWDALRGLEMRDHELIELCLLVGHYEMLAMTLNALRVQPDPEPQGSARAARLLAKLRST